MAKRGTGPKEAQLRAMRESKSGGGEAGNGFDVGSIMAAIEDFKRSQTQPVKDRLTELKAQRDKVEGEITQLERLLAQLEGRTIRGVEKEGGKRTRRSKEQCEADAKAIYSFVASQKHPVSAGEIRKNVPGAAKVINLKAFTEEYGGGKLKSEGQKAATRYTAA